MAPLLAQIGYGLVFVACLIGVFVFSASEPLLAIASGAGALLVARRAIHHHTHRLIVNGEELVITSAFGTRRIEFSQVRSITVTPLDSDSSSMLMVLRTPTREEAIPYAYAHFERLIELVLDRCPKAIVDDSRRPELR